MYCKTIKKRKKLLYRAMVTMLTLSMFSGLIGCALIDKYTSSEVHQIVSFSATSQSSMSRRPTYAFALRKEDGEWFFSATCHVDNPQSHYTSFNSFPIPAEDAEGLLKIIDEEEELKRLRKYREPLLTRLFASSLLDGGWDYTRVAFTDLEPLERETLPCDKVRDYLRDLAEKHCQAAESVEIVAVSVSRESPGPSIACSFTLEADEWSPSWLLSFHATLDCAGDYAEAEMLPIGKDDVDEILAIIKKQQLVTKAKQHEPSADDSNAACAETGCWISFRFMDGSLACTPIEEENELFDIFYSLAQANTCTE